MRLSEMQHKDIIDLNGNKIGNIIDVKIDENVFIKDRVYILNEERDIYDFLKNLHTNRYYLMSILNRNLTKKLINEEKNNDNLL